MPGPAGRGQDRDGGVAHAAGRARRPVRPRPSARGVRFRRQSTSTKRARAASRAATSSGVAPFCGPKIAAAPSAPSSGLSTSLASTKRAPSRRESKPGEVDPVQPGQGRAAGRQFVAVGVEELGAESLQDSGAAVGVGAAADAQDDLPAPGVERGPDQFPGAQAGGADGVLGLPCRRQHAPRPDATAISMTASRPRTANSARIGSPVGPLTTALRRVKPEPTAASRVPSPPSATGIRSTSSLPSAQGAAAARFQVPGDVRGRERSLELVRRYDDAHLRPAGPGWRWGRPRRSRPGPRTR